MPDIEIFGPASAGQIISAVRYAPYADKLAIIRSSKNVTDVEGRALSFVRISATLAFPPESMADLVRRLGAVISVEISGGLSAWFPHAVAVKQSGDDHDDKDQN